MATKEKLMQNLNWLEDQLSWMREHPYADIWQNMLIIGILETQYDNTVEILKLRKEMKKHDAEG